MSHNVKTGKLHNNMKYILINNKCSSSATIMFSVKVGSKNEINKHRGISHFIEHMLFKGTKNKLTTKNISNILYNHGAEFNANTGYELTRYYIKIDSDYILDAIDVLSDMLFYSKFDSDEIKSEKNVVISENKRDKSSPWGQLDRLMNSITLNNTNYSYDIGGIDKDITNFSRNTILKYFLHFYKASNITVTISGNYKYSPTKMVTILNKYFGKNFNYYGKPKNTLKYNTIVNKNFHEKQKMFNYKHKINNFSQAFISIAYPCYDGNSTNKYTTELVSSILGGNMSSRLFIKLREQMGLVYNISCVYYDFSDIGLLQINFSTFGDEKSILKCIKLVSQELHDLKNNLVALKEIDIAKNYFNGEILLELEDSTNLAELYSDSLLLYKKVHNYKLLKNNINKVTRDNIKNMSNKLFQFNKCNIAIISKKKISKKKIKDCLQKYL